MPPRNARQARPETTAQRAARRAARAASQATSDNGSHAGDGVGENQGNGPAQGQDQVNGPAQGQGQAAMDAAAVEELRRYREAYGGRLPQEGVAGGGLVPPLAVPAAVHAPSYWDMMKHLKSMQMEMFGGGADPIATDNWRRKLEKNFLSARCPPEYRRDLATHHLKDDAL
ncbi:unnamed protein product, partial [Brassica oleracea]